MITKKIVLIENHKQAYFIWKKNKLNKAILIHFDAHHDCDINYPSLINQRYLNDGNFIFRALKENIVNKFYWIIPGLYEDDKQRYVKVNQLLYQLKTKDSSINNNFSYSQGTWQTQICKKPLIITTIDKLTKFKETNVIIDIDLDYFFINKLTEANTDDNIGARKQWLSFNVFNKYLNFYNIKTKLTTISYSVNGGWVPMEYKYFANILVEKLGFNNNENKQKILAGKYFSAFRNLFERNKLKEAKQYYFLSLKLNHKYFSFDNNYGKLFIIQGDLNKAENEFNKMLIIDKNYYYSDIGLGICSLIKKDYKKAKMYFQRATNKAPISFMPKLFMQITHYLGSDYKNILKEINNCNFLLKNNIIKTIMGYVIILNPQNKKRRNIIKLNIFDNNLMEKILEMS